MTDYFVEGTVLAVPIKGTVSYTFRAVRSLQPDTGEVSLYLSFGDKKVCVTSSAIEELFQQLGYDQSGIPIPVVDSNRQDPVGFDYSKRSFPDRKSVV